LTWQFQCQKSYNRLKLNPLNYSYWCVFFGNNHFTLPKKTLLFTLPKIQFCRKKGEMYLDALVVLDGREAWWCSIVPKRKQLCWCGNQPTTATIKPKNRTQIKADESRDQEIKGGSRNSPMVWGIFLVCFQWP
jgi:hypothetical protein